MCNMTHFAVYYLLICQTWRVSYALNISILHAWYSYCRRIYVIVIREATRPLGPFVFFWGMSRWLIDDRNTRSADRPTSGPAGWSRAKPGGRAQIDGSMEQKQNETMWNIVITRQYKTRVEWVRKERCRCWSETETEGREERGIVSSGKVEDSIIVGRIWGTYDTPPGEWHGIDWSKEQIERGGSDVCFVCIDIANSGQQLMISDWFVTQTQVSSRVTQSDSEWLRVSWPRASIDREPNHLS